MRKAITTAALVLALGVLAPATALGKAGGMIVRSKAMAPQPPSLTSVPWLSSPMERGP